MCPSPPPYTPTRMFLPPPHTEISMAYIRVCMGTGRRAARLLSCLLCLLLILLDVPCPCETCLSESMEIIRVTHHQSSDGLNVQAPLFFWPMYQQKVRREMLPHSK